MTGQATRRDATAGAPESADRALGQGTSVIDAVARDIAQWAGTRNLAPVALSGFSLGFSVIAAVWLTGVSARADAAASAALLVSYAVCRAARTYGAAQLTASTDWAQGGCVLLAELAVYAGIAGGASANARTAADAGLTGPIGSLLHGTFVAGLGGAGSAGVWRLAAAAVVLLAVREMARLCAGAAKAEATVPPAGGRLVLFAAVGMLAGARLAFAVVLVLGALGLLARIGGWAAGSSGAGAPGGDVVGYRGDGPLSVWIGHFVRGRLPPMPPLVVGLLVTGMLAGLGVGNLPGILIFTPAEAMLLAALGSSHAHDGPRDWLVPALLHAGEYVFLAALGSAARVPGPVTLALLAAVVLRHFDLAYRARNRLSPAWFDRKAASRPGRKMPDTGGAALRMPDADWRGFGWEGRMIVAGIAGAAHILPYIYPVLAVYLWAVSARDTAYGWSAVPHESAGHAAVDR